MTSLSEMMARLPEERRRKISERAQELIAEERNRHDLCKNRQDHLDGVCRDTEHPGECNVKHSPG